MSPQAPTTGLRLRERGTVTAQGHRAPVVSADARVVIEGFDPATGRTRWSFDAGRTLGLIDFTSTPPQSGRNAVVLRSSAGALVNVDLETGRVTPSSASVQAWCRNAMEFDLAVQPEPDARPEDEHHMGQLSAEPCTAAGKPLGRPTSVPDFVGEMGDRTAGLIFWSDARSVSGAPDSELL
jgi:hypothetical protein